MSGEKPNLQSGKEWSHVDIADLQSQAAFGNTVAEIAGFLMRTEAEVREKAKELGMSIKEKRG